MFSTSVVPSDEPFDFHSSMPFVPSLAAKKTEEPTAVRLPGPLLPRRRS